MVFAGLGVAVGGSVVGCVDSPLLRLPILAVDIIINV